MKDKDDKTVDLKRIADIARAGVMCNIDHFDALCLIRMLTREQFDGSRTKKQIESDLSEAITAAKERDIK